MKAVSGKRLAKLAEQKGWVLSRINGIHHIYTLEGRIERLVIPMHGNHSLKIGFHNLFIICVNLSNLWFNFCRRVQASGPDQRNPE
jgi:predicted RNA binding protein YcfA (HicA-like mRNA interferase family)